MNGLIYGFSDLFLLSGDARDILGATLELGTIAVSLESVSISARLLPESVNHIMEYGLLEWDWHWDWYRI